MEGAVERCCSEVVGLGRARWGEGCRKVVGGGSWVRVSGQGGGPWWGKGR